MDLFSALFLMCVTFLFGVVATLAVQYYVLYSYLNKSPIVKPPERLNSVEYTLPDTIKKLLENKDLNGKNGASSLPITLVLQFLFHELRHSEAVKRWLYKKLSLEFEELLTKTTIGKFFETINIKDMNLGSQFPDIKDISIEEVKLDEKDGYIDTVSLCLTLDYTGNFLLSVDAKMMFGKTAYLSIKVKKISGQARLQFTRYPYTHWSFSFYNEPVLDLAVESHFQGRQLQSNITSLIVNQIKKAIKRKHTLPNYKIRYKPFFMKTDPSQLDSEDTEIVPQGQLEINCIEVTRLEAPANVQTVYCTMAVDTIPWICLYQNGDRAFMVLEITLTKLRQAQLGVIFRQDQNLVIIESVSPNSCASRAGLKPGDIVLAVENKQVNSVPQVAKFIRSISSATITLRVERITDYHLLRNSKRSPEKTEIRTEPDDLVDLTQTEQDNFIIVEKKESITAGGDVIKRPKCLSGFERAKSPEKIPSKVLVGNDNVSKFAQTIGNFSLRKRKTSVSEKSDSSTKNTPNSSGPGTPQHTGLKHNISLPSVILSKKHSISEVPEIVRSTESENGESGNVDAANMADVLRGKELQAGALLSFNDDFQFTLKDGQKYLNVNVWGQVPDDKDLLLGYINIPLSHILNECCNSVLGHYMRSYSFLPPTYVQPNSQTHPLLSHSGFEHVFCYGDILLSFIWNHDDDVELKRKMSTVTFDLDSKSTELVTMSKHDFIRTQFHRTTHCDFCSKKIWLKDAVQCRECGLCCHKKCVSKCQTSTGCMPPSDRRSDQADPAQPEITMTEIPSETPSPDGSVLKRVNSVNSLAIPGAHISPGMSRSLPPSPQRTPSRKQSISSVNPFALCPSVLEEVQKMPEEAAECVNRLLEQVMLCPPDETLMDAAKETGRQLYSLMPHEERVEKINLMMAELKKTLDSVTLEHMEITRQMSIEESESEKTKLAFLMGQADAKVHGLSVLMLHYCSSLQHTQEKIV